MSCPDNYTQTGYSCVSSKNTAIYLVFNPTFSGWSDTLSPSTKNQLLMQNWLSIQSYLQTLTQQTGMEGLIIKSITIGSVLVNALVSQSPTQDPAALFNTINNNINTVSSPTIAVISSTITATGFNPDNHNSTAP
jgi:hypothetical protein